MGSKIHQSKGKCHCLFAIIGRGVENSATNATTDAEELRQGWEDRV